MYAEQAKHETVPVTKASVWEAVCKGVSPQVLSNFLVLGLPGGVMMAADACSFDVTTVMASILGEPLPRRPPRPPPYLQLHIVSFVVGVKHSAKPL